MLEQAKGVPGVKAGCSRDVGESTDRFSGVELSACAWQNQFDDI